MSWDQRQRSTGRYRASPPCDACGKPVGERYMTDDEVCGDTDGPGFYLCYRKACHQKTNGLSAVERRVLYEVTRERADDKRNRRFDIASAIAKGQSDAEERHRWAAERARAAIAKAEGKP